MKKESAFKMKSFSGFGNSPVKKDLKYFLAGPKGRKRQDAEFENNLRMEEDAPRKLPEVTVVGKKSKPKAPNTKKVNKQPWKTRFTK